MVVINATFGGPSSRSKIRLKLNPNAPRAAGGKYNQSEIA
jgi:hypothetical protein